MRNVAIVLFDKIEVLDFSGPFEVFSVCGLRPAGPAPFHVFTVAGRTPVVARNGLSINPSYLFDTSPSPDIIIVPGGGGYEADGTPYGSRKEMNNPVLIQWIKENCESAELVLSVCTGALILAKAGLLEGLSATTHWGAMEELQKIAPNTKVLKDQRWVDNGKIILSAGVSAGIDMSLYVISRLLGKEVARENAQYMQYDYWR